MRRHSEDAKPHEWPPEHNMERHLGVQGDDAPALAALGRRAAQQGQWTEALAAFDRALARLAGDSALAADILRWKGTLYRDRGDTIAAEVYYQRSLALAERLDYLPGRAHALNCLGILAQRRGDLTAALARYSEAAALAAAAGDPLLLGMIEQNRGIVAAIRGDGAAALAYYRHSQTAYAGAGDAEATSWVLNNIAKLHIEQGQLPEALEALEQGLRIARERRSSLVEGLLEMNRATALLSLGREDEAAASCARALTLAEMRGDSLRRAEALRIRAILETRRRDFLAAMRSLEDAEALAAQAQDALLTAEVHRDQGDVHRHSGDAELARALWDRAIRRFADLGATRAADDVASRIRSLPEARRADARAREARR